MTWLNVNLLILNFNKTQYLKLRSMSCSTETNINYNRRVISNVTKTKFLGLIIEDTLCWKQNIDIVTYTTGVCGSVTNNTTRVRIGYRIYSLWRFITATGYNY
jgi:hypothetical protein